MWSSKLCLPAISQLSMGTFSTLGNISSCHHQLKTHWPFCVCMCVWFFLLGWRNNFHLWCSPRQSLWPQSPPPPPHLEKKNHSDPQLNSALRVQHSKYDKYYLISNIIKPFSPSKQFRATSTTHFAGWSTFTGVGSQRACRFSPTECSLLHFTKVSILYCDRV